MGKLDECLINPDRKYTPVDHKTSSSDPNRYTLIPAYQTQLDIYALLLEKNHRPTSGIGHLIYFYPVESDHLHRGFPMQVIVKTLKTSPENAFTEFLKAIKVLEGKMPLPNPECPFCRWHREMKKLVKK